MAQKSPFLVSFVNCQFEETADQIVYALNAQDAEDQTLRAFSSAHIVSSVRSIDNLKWLSAARSQIYAPQAQMNARFVG